MIRNRGRTISGTGSLPKKRPRARNTNLSVRNLKSPHKKQKPLHVSQVGKKVPELPPLDITIVGPVHWADGLGRISICCYEALTRHGFNVNCIHMPGGYDIGQTPVRLSSAVHKMVGEKQTLIPSNIADIVITTGILWTGNNNHPHKIHEQENMVRTIRTFKDKKRFIAGISMLEGDEIPQEWVKQLNELYDLAIVPAEFLVDIYKKCGVTIPITVIPLPIYGIEDLLQKEMRVFNKTPEHFNFGCLTGGWTRKGAPLLIKAFVKAFPWDQYPNLRLLIHVRFGDDNIMEKLRTLSSLDDRIIFTEGSISEEALDKWRQRVHCFVLPTAGEGFSIPPREMLARGIPCLISEGHAHKIIVEEEGAVGIKISHMRNAYYSYFGELGREWVPDFEDLVEKMRAIYTDYPMYKKNTVEKRKNLSRYSFSCWGEMHVPGFMEIVHSVIK